MKLHLQTVSLLSIFASINGFNETVIALQPEAIYQKANSAVVAIIALQNRQQVSYGSGVIISPTGWIVTANHVVATKMLGNFRSFSTISRIKYFSFRTRTKTP